MLEVNNIKGIRISIASPEKIREWSYGEVKKTRNYQLSYFKTRKRWTIL